MTLHLGIDQGGSKTVAVLFGSDGKLLSQGNSYGSCFYYDGVEHALEAIRQASQQAQAQAGVTWEDIRTVAGGIAGVNWPEEEVLISNELQHLWGEARIKVVNDCLIALGAGTNKPNAAVLCAGTGLNVALRGSGGIEVVYGSYIDRLDQGGRGLGERIHQALFDAEIGRIPQTRLTGKVLEFYELKSVVQVLYDLPRDRLKRSPKDMTYLLFELANEGDPAAYEIVSSFARNISSYITAGIAKYGLQETDFDVVLTGGLFKTRHPLLRETVVSEIHRIAPRAQIVDAWYEPVVGAVKLGLGGLYAGSIPEEVLLQCEQGADQYGLARV
ncbi:N-acetylglucosamine kinase [Paenibacillus sp. GCM10012307]|uniref:ATPase BadF/BadG/BcrA/BcrD type domain-containing protein n=1 Tax=Paenibacillus roseus TaxID=2798579 RepID=A0A934J3L3_9BACL|nr:BadF/BadG/BcrA/BcrD ATPase family protein [Paenibacillus roseus]MBJ6362654.1 hypothetical protein [Paenibacillus roseus]